MERIDLYRWLTECAAPGSACDAFDSHVCASVLAVALSDWLAAGRPGGDWIGVDASMLGGLAGAMFPAAREQLLSTVSGQVQRSADETCLRDLLWAHASDGSALQATLAAMIARRCLRPNHLWQDLGLRSRDELSWLMQRHFEPLAARNVRNMRWKKFFYRQICSDEGFALCSSPICDECDDFDACFPADEARADAAAPHPGK